MATPFDVKSWCDTTGLKKETSELLTKQDLDTKEALVLVTESDITNLEMTLGQRKLLVKAITELRKGSNVTTLDPDPVTTKSLAKDGGLDEILKKIEGIGGIDDPLLTLGATETPLPRLDSDPQVFLGTNAKPAQGAKGGEKPLLIPDFVSVNNLANNEEEQEIGSSGGASPTSSAQAPPQKSLARNRQQHVPSTICRQFNSPTGCQWPNCRFQHVCIISNCNQPHPQHEHPIPHTGS